MDHVTTLFGFILLQQFLFDAVKALLDLSLVTCHTPSINRGFEADYRTLQIYAEEGVVFCKQNMFPFL